MVSSASPPEEQANHSQDSGDRVSPELKDALDRRLLQSEAPGAVFEVKPRKAKHAAVGTADPFALSPRRSPRSARSGGGAPHGRDPGGHAEDKEGPQEVKGGSGPPYLRTLRVGADAQAALGSRAEGLAASYSSQAEDGRLSLQAREAAMLFSAAEAHLDSADLVEAEKAAAEALARFRELGDQGGAADVLRLIVRTLRLQGKAREAVQLAKEQGKDFRAHGNRRGEASMMLALAEAECKEGRSEEALSAATQAQSLSVDVGDVKLEATALLMLSQLHLAEDKSQGAVTAARAALELFRSHADRKGEAEAMHCLAEAQLAGRSVKEAQKFAKSARHIFREVGSKTEEAAALLTLAEVHLVGEQAPESVLFATEAMELSREIGFWSGEEAALYAVVDAYVADDQADQAVQLVEQVVERFRSEGNKQGEVTALDVLIGAHLAGHSRSSQHAPEKALRVADEALELCEQLGDKRKLAIMMLTVSQVMVQNKQHDGARQGFEQALEGFRDLGHTTGEATALLALANIHVAEAPSKALEEAKKSWHLLEQAGERSRAATALMLICWIHKVIGEYDRAIASATLAQEACQADGDRAGEANCYLTIATVHFESGDHDAALRAAKCAQELLQNPRSRQERKLLEDVLHWMAGIHIQSLGEPEEALELARVGMKHIKKAKGSNPTEAAEMKLLAADAKRELLWKEFFQEPPDPKRIKKRFDEALRTSELAVRLAKPLGEKHLLGKALHTLAHVYSLDERRRPDTLRTATEASQLLRMSGDTELEVRSLILLAQSQEMGGDRRAAIQTLDEAIDKSVDIEDSEGLEQAAVLREQMMEAPDGQAVPLAPLPAPAAPAVAVVQDAAAPVAEEAYHGPDPELVRQTLLSMVQHMTGSSESIDGDTPLMETGIDSLASVELRSQLQQEFHLNLPSAVMFNYPTVSRLSQLLVDECTDKKIEWSRG